MLPSLHGASSQSPFPHECRPEPQLPPQPQPTSLSVIPPTPFSARIGYRDDAIRTAFAAFDAAAHPPDTPGGDPRDRGVCVNAIDDYLKCIFGMPHHGAMIGARAAQHIEGLDTTESSTPHAPSVARLTALAAFYIGLCQGHAFNADGSFDTAGLIDFVAARLEMPKRAVEQDMICSTLGAYVFMSMKRNLSMPQLSIYDAHGEDLVAPSPSLRFDAMPQGAICKGYLRKVTISVQIVRAVDISDADLTDAEINNSTFQGVLFSNANLSGAAFNNVCLMQCSFVGTDLPYAAFRDSGMNSVEFQKCKMAGVGFHATVFDSTRFEQCDLRDMVFDNDSHFGIGPRSSIDTTEFHACDMTGAHLRDVQWCDGGFTDCLLWNAAISDSKFTRSHWRHQSSVETKPPLAGAKLEDVVFHECDLTRLNADESQWTHCAFEKGNITEASWRHSAVFGIRFSAVEMPRVRFDNALCRGLRIEAMCVLEGALFAHAKLIDVHFDGVQGRSMLRLNCTDFSSAELENVRFVKCQMISAKFPFAHLTGVEFMLCALNYTDFDRSVGADLLGMLMANRMKHYSAESMIIQGGDIGSLGSLTRRVTLLNHIANNQCLLSNVLSGTSGAMTANLVLYIADRLFVEAHDPVDSDTWMIAALMQAHAAIPFDGHTRARIDVHMLRMLQRHADELKRLEWRTRPENRWALGAVEHFHRLVYKQLESAPGK